MFEPFVKDFLLKKAPSSVIPVGISTKDAKEKYNLDDIYKLASNENPFGVSPKALEAMTSALLEGHLYPDSARDVVLNGKLAKKHSLLPENIMLTCGAANALSFVGEVFLLPGDECIIPSPAYPPYYYIAYKNGANIIDVPSNEEMQLDKEAILKAITDKTKVIFLCNPCNPTGYAMPGEELFAFIQKFPRNVIVVLDEAYIDFAHNPDEMTMVPRLKDLQNMIVIQTFSKTYGLAGIRIGYAMACKEIIGYMNKAMTARSLSTVGIEGAIAALDDAAFKEKTILNNTAQREYLTKELTAMGFKVYASEANFIYVDFKQPCENIYFKLIAYGIMIRGDFPCIRITIGTPEQNKKLVSALSDLAAKKEI